MHYSLFKNSIIASLDTEKAFDIVNWTSLYHIRKILLWGIVINWIKIEQIILQYLKLVY